MSDFVSLPTVTFRLALSGLKQYALVLHSMYEGASSPEGKVAFHKARRDIMDLIKLVEDYGKP